MTKQVTITEIDRTMNQQISPEDGYRAEQAQNDMDMLELAISHERTAQEQLETAMAQLQDRQKAAQELLAAAQQVLEKPRVIGMPLGCSAAATDDKRMAAKALAECATKIPIVQQQLEGSKALLAQYEARKKEFPNEDALRAKRHLDALRRRVRNK